MIYRIEHYVDDLHQGYEYFGNLREARRRFAELKRISRAFREEGAGCVPDPELQSAPTPRTKAEVLELLRRVAW